MHSTLPQKTSSGGEKKQQKQLILSRCGMRASELTAVGEEEAAQPPRLTHKNMIIRLTELIKQHALELYHREDQNTGRAEYWNTEPYTIYKYFVFSADVQKISGPTAQIIKIL